MRCPFCDQSDNGVVDSRETDENHAVRRRRKCNACSRRFTTYERVEAAPLFIVKKDGRRQKFDRARIARGIERACEKRPVSAEQMEALALEIERAAHELGEREVSAHWVGERVMDSLRRTDEVAYVRFASVYRSFRDATEFAREIESLQQDERDHA